MPELEVPEESSFQQARELVREFADVGDTVEVYDTVMVKGETNRRTGTIVDLEDEFLTLDTDSVSNDRIRYDDIDRLSIVAEADEQ